MASGQTRSSKPYHATLAEFVLNELRKQIVLGELEAGSRLEADQLAKELGSSRIPIREALRQLEAEGLVVNNPRRGVLVREVYKQDIDDAYDMLECVELLAIKRAAAHITPELIKRMQQRSAELELLEHQADSASEVLAAHRSFHFMMFEAIGDGPLLRHLTMLWHACERYVVAGMKNEPPTHSSDQTHAEFVERIAEGQSVREIQKVIKDHLRVSRARAHRALG